MGHGLTVESPWLETSALGSTAELQTCNAQGTREKSVVKAPGNGRKMVQVGRATPPALVSNTEMFSAVFMLSFSFN